MLATPDLDRVTDGLRERRAESERVPVTHGDGVVERVSVWLCALVTSGDADVETDSDDEDEDDMDGEDELEAESKNDSVNDSVEVGHAAAVAELVREERADAVSHREMVTETVTVSEAVGVRVELITVEGEPLKDAVALMVPVVQIVALGVDTAEKDAVELPLPDADDVGHTVALAVILAVAVCDGVNRRDPEGVEDVESVTDLDIKLLVVDVAVPDEESDVLPVEVAVWLELKLAQGEAVRVVLDVELAEGQTDEDKVAHTDDDAQAVMVIVGVGDTLRDVH